MVDLLRRSLRAQLDGSAPLGVAGPIRGLVLSLDPPIMSKASSVGSLSVLPAGPGEPALAQDDALALARADLLGRSGGSSREWSGRALRCGLFAAALLTPFVVLAGLLEPLGRGDVDDGVPLVIYLAPLLAVVLFLLADRARREDPEPRARVLLEVVLPWTLIADLMALRRAGRGVVVLPPARSGPAAVLHPTRPPSCPVPPSEGDEWCWWIGADGTNHSFGSPSRWWHRGAAPGARQLLAAAVTADLVDPVRAIVVRRRPGSRVLHPPLYVIATDGGGLDPDVARRRALDDLDWRTGPRGPDVGATWRCVDLMRGGACATFAFLLPAVLVVAGFGLDLGTSVALLYFGSARMVAGGWRRHRMQVEERQAVVLPPEAPDEDVRAALRQIELQS